MGRTVAMHDFLSYRATKHVLIRDPVMGILQYFLIFVVVTYLIGWRLIYEKGFLLTERVTGIVQTNITAGEIRQSSEYKYCQGSSLDFSGGVKLPCTTGPAGWVAAPSNGGEEIFIATRLSEGQTSKYVINPDDHIVGVTWEVQALSFYKTAEDSAWSKGLPDITTRLLGNDGQEVLDAVTRVGRYDNFPLYKLLYAAGITNLDHQHDAGSASTESYRYLGVVLVLNIDCIMGLTGGIKYCDYRVNRLAKTEAQARVSDAKIDSQDKGVQERRGVKITVHATGTMGRVDFNAIMLSICIALGAIKVFSVIVDFMMTYLLPYKGVYALHMREESVNFQDLRSKSPRAQREVHNMKKQKAINNGKAAPSASGSPRESPRWPASPHSSQSHMSMEAPSHYSSVGSQQQYSHQGIAPPAAISTNTHGSHLGGIGEHQLSLSPQSTPPSQFSSANQAQYQQFSPAQPGPYGVVQPYAGVTQPHGVVAGLGAAPYQAGPYQATYKQRAPAVINVDD